MKVPVILPPQQDIKSLLKQINTRDKVPKDVRIQACHELFRCLTFSDYNVVNIKNDKKDILGELAAVIHPKYGSLEVKKWCGRIAGMVGASLVDEFDEFVKWTETQLKCARPVADEEQAIFVSALRYALVELKSRRIRLSDHFAKCVLKIIAEFLDFSNSHLVFFPILDVCREMAEEYPSIFDECFEEIVDYLFGWALESSMPSSVPKKCHEVIKSLAPFWHKRPDFGRHLMSQFLDDVGGYIEDYKKHGSLRNCISKACAVLRILIILLEVYVQNRSNAHQVYWDILHQTLTSCNANMNRLGSEPSFRIGLFLSEYCGIFSTALSLVDLQDLSVIGQCAITVIEIMRSVYFEFFSISSLPAEFTLPFGEKLGILSEKPLFQLPLLGRPKLASTLLNLLTSMMSPSVLPLLLASYSAVRKKLLCKVSSLREEDNKEILLTRETDSWLMILIGALGKLASLKNSLIVMMGLRPSLFHLLLMEMPLTDQWFISDHPAVHYCLLNVVQTHVMTHDYFLSNSKWLVQSNSPSCMYAQEQLQAIERLLNSQIKWDITKELCVEWLHGLLSGVDETAMASLSYRPEFVRIRWAVLTTIVNGESYGKLQAVASQLHALSAFDDKNASTITNSITSKLKSVGYHTGAVVWASIDMQTYLRCSLSTIGWDQLEVGQFRLHHSSFGTDDFMLIMKFLLDKIIPSMQRNQINDDDWMVDFVDKLYAERVQNDITCKNDSVEHTDIIQKWRRLLACVANYCIENRMKTPLGKPMDTFNKLGGELLRLAREVSVTPTQANKHNQNRPHLVPSKDKGAKDGEGEDGIGFGEPRMISSAEEWWRVRCLLEFVEIFEKLMFHVTSGTMFPICNVSMLSRQFFATNMVSCQEWLFRTYPVAMIVAYHNGHYAQVIRLGASVLPDLERKQLKAECGPSGGEATAIVSGQSMAILCWIARAMAELGAEQAVLGLSAWARKIYHTELPFLTAIAEIASARYERSLVLLRTCIEDQTLSETFREMLKDVRADVLARLRHPIFFDAFNCPTEFSLWSEAEKLDTEIPSGIDAETFTRLKQLSMYGKIEVSETESGVAWDFVDVSYRFRPEVATMKDNIAVMGSLVLMTDGGQRLHGRLSALNHIAGCVLRKMSRKGQPDTDRNMAVLADLGASFLVRDGEIDDIGERIRLGRQLILWAERLGCSNSSQLHLPLAKLARKTCNPLLAGVHLHKASSNPILINNSPVLNNLRVAVQGSKMMWEIAPPEQRARSFITVFATLQGGYETFCHSYQVLAVNVNMEIPPPFDGVNGYVNRFNTIPAPFGGAQPNIGVLSPASSAALGEEMSRTCLRLAKWLIECPQLVTALPPECRQSRLWLRLETAGHELMGCDMVGSLLVVSTEVCPTLGKAHRRLGDWAFHSAESAASENDKLMFHKNYRVLLGENISDSVLNALWTSLNTANSLAHLREVVLAALPNDTVMVESILSSDSHFTSLWAQLRQRRSVFYSLAVSSYFSYIAQLGGKTATGNKGTIDSVSATLRILGLLAKHADLLHEVIDQGLRITNEHLWKDILPQLFARLSHPVKEVRESLLGLLSKLCFSAPHTLVFQAVAGASSSMLVTDDDDVIGASEKDDDESSNRGCRVLVTVLEGHYPELVKDVREFVNELQRINLLNEERWTFVLANLDHEMEKRLEQIRAESEKTVNATHLDDKTRLDIITEKSRLITSSVYRILDDLYERTCLKEPSTQNERLFVQAYGEKLQSVFEQSRANRKSAEKSWAPFKHMLGILLQKNTRRGGHSLQMPEISNVLNDLSKSKIPIPGQENIEYSEVVTIDRVLKNALILPTKTRPKKIAFIGSDGKEHMFLFKGQEDLHLDERIMQLLHICNLMLAGSSSKRRWPPYCARHYAVTPLGTRSGLIQWVGGATPMFHIYRKWQLREAQIKHSMERKSGVPATTAALDVDRPTDLFQKKMRGLFTAHNVETAIIADRSKWPQNLLREVFNALVKETPKDLISRELWMRSGSCDTWWRVVCRYARSTAVMSMIGAILGLGDRHLDNVLVNLDRGDVVHIDYNICFDKVESDIMVSKKALEVWAELGWRDQGRHLRIPETVPFRLTQNILHALGPTQVEGVFRESCSQVLSTLREGREVLLTVLDAFVYDPLVDWAVSDHLTASSAAVGVAVTLAVYGNFLSTNSRVVEAKPVAREMFSVRIRENNVLWTKNFSELQSALASVVDVLQRENKTQEKNVWKSGELLRQERVEAGRRLKASIARHHNIMKDFRPLLKALATCDERFASYVHKYRERFSEPLVKAHQLLDVECLDLDACLHHFAIVQNNISDIYSGLLSLNEETQSIQQHSVSSISPCALKTESPEFPPGFEDSRPHHTQQQEQNVHASNVVRRVRSRLEGRIESSDQQKVVSASEQVDILIGQATNANLLALMYEGWTAWNILIAFRIECITTVIFMADRLRRIIVSITDRDVLSSI
ncbi:FATC domain protein [Dictyocaulus viviparus]|uniref:non-specific serine/threonine protein kinase n=1 Tax=Dictyocaulus viviparus TaxID=29172 RepID=A0A0D8XFW3_DICVI|nr:FATC domain protein [Dictyocaulus viviparus]